MKSYIVKNGDNISSIAKKFDVKVVDLIKENNLENTYDLMPGLEIIIPSNDSEALNYYVVENGDTLYKLGQKYNIDPNLLAEINGLELNEYLYEGQKLLVPLDDVKIYITKEGDTLNYVADDLGIPRDNILLYNDNIYLMPGQLIAYKIINK